MQCNICQENMAEGKMSAQSYGIQWLPKKIDKQTEVRPKILANSLIRYASTISYYCTNCEVLITPVPEQNVQKTLNKIVQSEKTRASKKSKMKPGNIYSTKRR